MFKLAWRFLGIVKTKKNPLLSKHECALWTPCTMQLLKEKICKVSFRIYALAETSFKIVVCRAFLMKTLKLECWIHKCPKLLYYRVRLQKPRPNQPCDFRWKNIPGKSNFSSAVIKTGNRHLTSLKTLNWARNPALNVDVSKSDPPYMQITSCRSFSGKMSNIRMYSFFLELKRSYRLMQILLVDFGTAFWLSRNIDFATTWVNYRWSLPFFKYCYGYFTC